MSEKIATIGDGEHTRKHEAKLVRLDNMQQSSPELYERHVKRGDIDGEPLIDELRRLIGNFELTKQLRYRHKDEDPRKNERKRKENHETTESTGDHIAMMGYLTHYFLPILEKEGIKLKYEQIVDMILSHDIADASTEHTVGIKKDVRVRTAELEATAKVFEEMPQRNGFNQQLRDSFSEYIARDTQEAKFVRALNGLESMMYLMSSTRDECKKMIAGNGYTKADYQNRIGVYCEEFPTLEKVYKLLEKTFIVNGYFSKEAHDRPKVLSVEEERNIFADASAKTSLETPDIISVEDENQRISRMYNLKDALRFGHKIGDDNHPGDSVGEHTGFMFLLARYSLPEIKKGKLENSDSFTLWNLNWILLAHDVVENITGDEIVYQHSDERDDREERARGDIVNIFSPRAGGMNKSFNDVTQRYELEKNKVKHEGLPATATPEILIKALDGFEALLHLFDKNKRLKLTEINENRIKHSQKTKEDSRKFFEPFPTLLSHYDALMTKFKEENIF